MYKFLFKNDFIDFALNQWFLTVKVLSMYSLNGLGAAFPSKMLINRLFLLIVKEIGIIAL